MPHLLIVDDDHALLQALPETLRLRLPGVRVDIADSGTAALQRIGERDYDAIVCDIKMPGMDGLAVLRQIQELRPQIPTLLITGHGEHDLAVQALRGGAYDFIQKPIDRDYFIASLRRAIEKRQLGRQIEQQKQSLEQHASNLKQTVRQRTRALREANRAKDNFLATLAHELRNPLASIRNAVEVIGYCDGSSPDLTRAGEIIRRQVTHMARLLDDLLDISRIQHGKIKLHCITVELAELVRYAVDACRPLIDGRGHHLSVQLPAQPLHVYADTTRLEQILCNLLNNAAKYTEPGGGIACTLQRDGQEAVVCVRDTGIGIAPEMIGRIFDPFAQADQSLDRSLGGLGIGLTLVRHLVHMHGGNVSAHSEGIGHGSEFIVRLPLAAVPADTRQIGPDPHTGDGEIRRQGDDDAPPQDGLSPGAPVARTGGAGLAGRAKRILVIEDNPDSRDMLGRLLALWGHEPELVADGRQGLAAIQRARPDVALVDIGLPGLSGYEVARYMRNITGGESIYIIALTGYGQPADRQRTREAGFDAHLVKPVDLKNLQQLLSQLAGVGRQEAGERGPVGIASDSLR